jgi:hypothetical protein
MFGMILDVSSYVHKATVHVSQFDIAFNEEHWKATKLAKTSKRNCKLLSNVQEET